MKKLIVQAVFLAGLAVTALAADGLRPANPSDGTAGTAGNGGRGPDGGGGSDPTGGWLFSTNTTPASLGVTPQGAEATALNL